VRLAFFTTRRSLATHPSAWSLLQRLADNHVAIDVFAEVDVLADLRAHEGVASVFPAPAAGNERAESATRTNILLGALMSRAGITPTSRGYRLGGRIMHARDGRRRMDAARTDPRRLAASSSAVALFDEVLQAVRYDVCVGMGHEGLALARWSLPGVPLVYFSDELFYSGHPEFGGPAFRMAKRLEAEAFVWAALVMVQDEERARLLFADNEAPWDPSRVVYCPVSWLGPGVRARTDWLKERWPQLRSKRVLLQHGSIVNQRRSGQLMKASSKCPDDMVVVFHGGLAPNLARAARTTRAIFSPPDVPLEELHKVVASADIGLVFYAADNENDRLIAHASGQLALFLQCGIPVIAGGGGTHEAIVREYGCGLVVARESEVFSAARAILADYDAFSARAIACFEKEYNLDEPLGLIVQRLSHMAARAGIAKAQ